MIALAPDGDVDGAPPRLAALQPDRRGGAPRPRKTAFALGAATHAAVREQLPVIFFSLEMDYLELTQRILAAEAGINSRLLRTGRIPESDWSKISATVGAWPKRPYSSTTIRT